MPRPVNYDELNRGSGKPKQPTKKRVIYQPRGRAYEYSALACNLYTGCSHSCTYCYAPAVSRKTMTDFVIPKPRPNVLEKLEKDCQELSGDSRRVLFCFLSDPYQPLEAELKITRQALEICGENNVKANVLTKNGALAMRDFDLMEKYDVRFGTTLLFVNDQTRREFEPNAGTVADRIHAIQIAKVRGIKTWVSIEPVISTRQALDVIVSLGDAVDLYKIGKLNHDKARENRIDWQNFLRDALYMLNVNGLNYLIKDDLWKFATLLMKEEFMKQELGE